MVDKIGEFSDDGYWVFTEEGWGPTAKQSQALADRALPHVSALKSDENQPTLKDNDSTENTVEKVEVMCLTCNARLKYPRGHSGGIKCPTCSTIFSPESVMSEPAVLLGSSQTLHPNGEDLEAHHIENSISEGDKQLTMLIGGIIILFGIVDLLSFYLFDIDITGVWWSAYLAGSIGLGIVNIEVTSFGLESVEKSSQTQGIFAGIGAFGLVIILLAVFLSAPDGELAGTWINDVDTLVLSENGEVTVESGVFSDWRADSDTIMFTDSTDPEYEWWFEYKISNDVLYLAPLALDDSIIETDCIVYVKQGVDFDNALEGSTIPKWCNPSV
jgi:LSD1 subclass zinc finger protein